MTARSVQRGDIVEFGVAISGADMSFIIVSSCVFIGIVEFIGIIELCIAMLCGWVWPGRDVVICASAALEIVRMATQAMVLYRIVNLLGACIATDRRDAGFMVVG